MEFPADALPSIQDALYVMVGEEKRVMEVAQHIGHDTARCFMLAPSEGIGRGMEVISTGRPHYRSCGQAGSGPDVQRPGRAHRR